MLMLTHTLCSSGEFFLPDGSYGNDKTGVLVYSDGTHEMFDVMDTQHNMEQLSELRVRDEEDPDYESSSSVPEDNTSPTLAPSIEEPVEHNTYPVETAPDVLSHDHPDSEHSEEPKLEEPQSEESEDPENPEITGEEDPEQPSHSIDSQGEESSLPHKPNANETAPTKTDFPDATEVDLPYSPSFTALHTSYDSKINSSMTQTLMEPPTKPTSDVATSMPEGHMSSQPLSTYSTATSTKVANITGNTFATSVPESDDLAVPLLARIEWVYICMLLGLLGIF